MQIQIDEKAYNVPPDQRAEVIQLAKKMILSEYAKLNENIRFLLKPIARGYLQSLENKARQKLGKEASLFFRPEGKADAVIFLIQVFEKVAAQSMENVTIAVSTNEDRITNLAIIPDTNQGGGPMVTHGDLGEREDNGVKIP